MCWRPTVLGCWPPSGATRCPSCDATTGWCWPASRTTTTTTGRTCRTVTSWKSPQRVSHSLPWIPLDLRKDPDDAIAGQPPRRRLGVSRVAPRRVRRPAEDTEVVAAQVVLRFGGQRPVRPDHPVA